MNGRYRLLLIAASSLALATCSGCGGNKGSPDEDTTDVSTAQVETTFVGTLTMVRDGVEPLFEFDNSLSAFRNFSAQNDKEDDAVIIVTATDSCAANEVPAPTGDAVTLHGAGGGTCVMTSEWQSGGANSFIVQLLLDCSGYDAEDDGEALLLNGQIGLTVTGTFDEMTVAMGSRNLEVSLDDELSCAVAIAYTSSIDNANNTIEASGCLTLCGQSFSTQFSGTMEGEGDYEGEGEEDWPCGDSPGMFEAYSEETRVEICTCLLTMEGLGEMVTQEECETEVEDLCEGVDLVFQCLQQF